MTETGAKRINEAIRDCLRACFDAESPLMALAAYLSTLRQAPGWNDADIDLVELRAHQMLKLMVRRSTSGDLEPLAVEEKRPQTRTPEANKPGA